MTGATVEYGQVAYGAETPIRGEASTGHLPSLRVRRQRRGHRGLRRARRLVDNAARSVARRNAYTNFISGCVMAELADASAVTIPGFERFRCVHLVGDSPNAARRLNLAWGNPPQYLPDPAVTNARVRFRFRDVRLYSVSH